ncbi:polysaccharide deacetylase family protein [Roseobacteraceae bacterium NS-SX3]
MTPDWSPLDRELAAWRGAGLTLPLWWRDDDATTPTPALSRLAEMSERLGLPVHLAVIPRDATGDLADHVRKTPRLIPVVHGWAHRNHAPKGEKKAEFGAHRPVKDMLADAERGLARLEGLFGEALRPVFVPPWNRIAPAAVEGLAQIGYRALSAFTPRKRETAAPGLLQVNTHLDPVDWKGSRSLLPPERLIAQAAQQLRDRREGRADNSEPYGLLTHHLVHDTAIWDFTEALAARLMAGPGEAWVFDERIS